MFAKMKKEPVAEWPLSLFAGRRYSESLRAASFTLPAGMSPFALSTLPSEL